ncbi:MAG: uroporphyrinogen decarboxylase family protein [Firmicutes bacterium]|nr:uroporphyrinogen decarboxylase family protein [Bacillota bacterium]
MTNRERALAALRYEPWDHLPVVHFGFWEETRRKWAAQGHITEKEARSDRGTALRLGFDFEWGACAGTGTGLRPGFTREVIREFPDGTRHVRNSHGVVELEKDGVTSIRQEISHLLEDRAGWEAHYLPRLQYTAERVPRDAVKREIKRLEKNDRDERPVGLFIGSLYGCFRDWAGVTGTSYIYADDEELYKEILDTIGDLSYRVLEETLALCPHGLFDFAHMWEDICFKTGPLVIPKVFRDWVGPHYKRMTALLKQHGTGLVSLDCDGCVDALLPIWLENGVNVMFPMEVGTWGASIAPWREQYGRELRGVGGMNKNVFSKDFDAIDEEIERLRPLVALGGYIPCPDHRIAPDAKWENVKYYVKRMREVF